MKNMPLKDIMIRNPVTLNIDESFCKVAQIFKEKDIRHLPIVNTAGMIMGILSQRDLNRIASPQKTAEGEYIYDMDALATYLIKQHIIHNVVTLLPEDTLEKAVELMAERKLGCIPVVDPGGKVIGIVSVIDALKLFLKALRQK